MANPSFGSERPRFWPRKSSATRTASLSSFKKSPLNRYGIKIIQFSVTETTYDDQTLQQFAAKKQSYLAAEQAKAQRQEEQQQRLMIIERGLRQVAETEAAANLEKKKATVAAQQEQEVAVIKKAQAVDTGSAEG